MNSLTQIGIAALTRVFKSKRYKAQSIEFPSVPFDLTSEIVPHHTNDHHGSMHFVAGVDYYIWGIELGLQYLDVESCTTFADALAAYFAMYGYENVIPSHIIVCSWCDGDMCQKREESFEIFRFTQVQDRLIEDMTVRT